MNDELLPVPDSTTSRPRRRALVLGGGGSAGNAWLIGVIAGLSDAGVDVTDADLVVGTSAGATAAAQITGADLTTVYEQTLVLPSGPRAGLVGSDGRRGPGWSVADHLARTDRVIAEANDAADMRRRMGAAAIELDAAAEASRSEQWRATVAARLPRPDWPDRAVVITAVDGRTGDPVVFDRHSGIDLADAVAASTSGGPALRVGENRYIDGGYRRNENADLAAGYEQVLVLSPLGGRTRHPLEWGMQLATQVDELRAAGSRVETILPDHDSLAAFGGRHMDPATRPPAARAGRAQGEQLAEQLGGFWC